MYDLSPAAALKARADQFMLPRTRYWPDDPIVFDHGRCAHFVDITGKDYIDMFGGVATVSVGYNNERVAVAIAEQLGNGGHCSELVLNETVVRAAELLAVITPKGLTKSYFTNSGSQANELAARIVMRTTGRTGLVSLMHAYHGRTPTAAELTFQAS